MDTLSNGWRCRILCIVDDFSRECLAAMVDTSLSGKRVVPELERLVSERAVPQVIVSDNVRSQKAIAVTGQTSPTACDASNLVVWQSAKKEKEFGWPTLRRPSSVHSLRSSADAGLTGSSHHHCRN
jgi:hypothetical protein